MNQVGELNWIRRFYRAHLARYRWAQLLKHAYLVLRLYAVQLRAYLVWRVNHRLATCATYLSRLGSQSQNPIVRHPAKMGASVFYFALLRVLYLLTGQQPWWYTMQGFSKYCGASDTGCIELVPAREILLAMPSVYPEEFRRHFNGGGLWPLRVPSVSAFEVPKASVMGKSDLLFLEDQCLHHEMYRFDQDLLFEEMHDVVCINAERKRLVRFKGQQVGTIPAGISLVGSATANYVHWLTETLPKLALIDQIEIYQDLPYIIDAGLHSNILESVRHLNSRGRSIIQLGRSEILAVDKLIAISPVAYVPFDFKTGIKPENIDINPGTARYSPDGLQRVRQLLVERLGVMNGASKRRLFLRRTGNTRPMKNSIEIEALVREYGFEIVEPETLSFAEQVRLFSTAELIISQGGAALGNMIFAPAGCHVIVLTTWSPYTVHYYFANMAALLGQRCTLIMCEPVQSDLGPHRAHMGVNVSMQILKEAIHQ